MLLAFMVKVIRPRRTCARGDHGSGSWEARVQSDHLAPGVEVSLTQTIYIDGLEPALPMIGDVVAWSFSNGKREAGRISDVQGDAINISLGDTAWQLRDADAATFGAAAVPEIRWRVVQQVLLYKALGR